MSQSNIIKIYTIFTQSRAQVLFQNAFLIIYFFPSSLLHSGQTPQSSLALTAVAIFLVSLCPLLPSYSPSSKQKPKVCKADHVAAALLKSLSCPGSGPS